MKITIHITLKGILKALLSIVVLLFLGLYVFIYSNDKTYITFYNATKGYDVKFGKGIVTELRDGMLNIPPSRFFHSIKDLAKVQITLEDSANQLFNDELKAIRKSQKNFRKDRSYFKIDIENDSSRYNGKARIHGSCVNNWNAYPVSLKVKSKQGNFNLIAPRQHNYFIPLLLNPIAKKLNLLYNEQELVEVDWNNEYSALMLKEERFDKAYLKKHKINGVIVKLEDCRFCEHTYNASLHEVSNLKLKKDSNALEVKQHYYEMMEAVRSNNVKGILSFLDENYMARFEAYRMLIASPEDFNGDNFKWIYNKANKKFYPLVRSEGDMETLRWYDGVHLLKSYNPPLDSIRDEVSYRKLLQLLREDDAMNEKINNVLFHFIVDYKEMLLIEWDSNWEKYYSSLVYEAMGPELITFRRDRINGFRKRLDANLDAIWSYLNEGSVHIIRDGSHYKLKHSFNGGILIVPKQSDKVLEVYNSIESNELKCKEHKLIITESFEDLQFFNSSTRYTIDKEHIFEAEVEF